MVGGAAAAGNCGPACPPARTAAADAEAQAAQRGAGTRGAAPCGGCRARRRRAGRQLPGVRVGEPARQRRRDACTPARPRCTRRAVRVPSPWAAKMQSVPVVQDAAWARPRAADTRQTCSWAGRNVQEWQANKKRTREETMKRCKRNTSDCHIIVRKRKGAAAPPPDASMEPIQTHDASERARPGPLLLRREGRDELLNLRLVFLELLHKLAPQFLWGVGGGEGTTANVQAEHDTHRPDQWTKRAYPKRERASAQCTNTTGSPWAGSHPVQRRLPPPSNLPERHASSPKRPPKPSRTNRISTDDTASASSAVTCWDNSACVCSRNILPITLYVSVSGFMADSSLSVRSSAWRS